MSRPKFMVPCGFGELELKLNTGQTVMLKDHLADIIVMLLREQAEKVGGKRRASSYAVQLGTALIGSDIAERALHHIDQEFIAYTRDALAEKNYERWECALLDAIEEHGAVWAKKIEEARHG